MHQRTKKLLGASCVLVAVAAIPLAAPALQSDVSPSVAARVRATAKVETPPLFDDDGGGNADADDPAIWLHPTDASRSLVITAAKNGGLFVYNLAGQQLQAIPAPAAPGPDDEAGRFNNVDLVYGFRSAGSRRDLAVVTDRGRDQLRFYAIDAGAAAGGRAPLTDVTAPSVPFVFSNGQQEVNEQRTAYGLATANDRELGPIAVVSRRERTDVAVLRLISRNSGVSYREISEVELPAQFDAAGRSWTPCQDEDGQEPQVEGMVIDTEKRVVYMGQEQVGIWKVPLGDDDNDAVDDDPVLVDRVRTFGVPYDRVPEPTEPGEDPEFSCAYRRNDAPAGVPGRHLEADVEGLTIYYAGDRRGYLLASSQGDDRFVVYERGGEIRFVGDFVIGDGTIDGAQESDGAMVLNVSLGSQFPNGLFVTQDGQNTPDVPDSGGEARANTNFKFVPWEQIARGFVTPLIVDTTSYRPR